MKRLLCNTLIIIMLMGVCFNGCFDFGCLSVSNRFSYAEADNWSACDSSDLVTAFRYYCKSRNLALEGSAVDALTTFTTTTFNNLCSTLGIDPTQLQAELKKTTQGNLGLRFLFSNTGITAYNRLFAEFLQNNDLEIGDQVDNKQVWSGRSFTDDNGNSAVVFEIEHLGTYNNPIKSYGSPYVYTHSQLVNMAKSNTLPHNVTFNIDNNVYTMNLSGSIAVNGRGNLYWYKNTTQNSYWRVYEMSNSDVLKQTGYSAIVYDRLTSKLYLGSYVKSTSGFETAYPTLEIAGETEDENVNITTNNKTINNNNYNNNWTIIYNEGDTYIDNDDPEPPASTPPGGGGGGGDNPTDPNPDDPLAPYDPDKQFPDTPDNPTTDPGVHGSPGSDGTITIPDFNFDIPDINWSLDGLQHKFPFSLPFDLYNACKLLNAEPETPELDYTIDLVVYDWRVNYDLHWLDPAARVIRTFELLAFVVGLILITRRLIGG